ncbi:MAG: hypothetical protein A2297_05070 [Elusimicrobia bacterium RIFOXYB2_FULL_48_7]|nr:MAG: hypothetical protein A2297_05070 [Elusimicrobia bacterium RIFOXYB2_FULL_48_7]
MKKPLIVFFIFMSCVFTACDSKHNPLIPGPNNNPVITAMNASPSTVYMGGSSTITLDADDQDGDNLHYSWSSAMGSISGSGSRVSWIAPGETGTYTISVSVSDGRRGLASRTIEISVSSIKPANQNPVIYSLTANPAITISGEASAITASVIDPDGDPLTYSWSASAPAPDGEGVLNYTGAISGSGQGVSFSGSTTCCPQQITVLLTVNDNKGGATSSSIQLTINPKE